MNLNTQKEVMRAARPSLLKEKKKNNQKIALKTSLHEMADQTKRCLN